jgi:hypothetical protein
MMKLRDGFLYPLWVTFFFENLLCTLTPEERKSGVLNDGKRLQGAGRLRLYIFGNKNPTFKEFLREVRRAVEEKEFVKSLPPLEVTAEEMAQYIDNTPSARVRYTRSARPELTIARWGTDILFTPNIPFFGVSSINCRGDREGIEFLSILYSGLAFSGFGDFGGRIMINESEELYQTEEVYKNFNYKWGELAEMMIDLDERRIIFFNPVEEKF